MAKTHSKLALRAILVAGMGVLGLATTSRTSRAEARLACITGYCDWTCSLLHCVGNAECKMSGTCVWDSFCQSPAVFCDPAET